MSDEKKGFFARGLDAFAKGLHELAVSVRESKQESEAKKELEELRKIREVREEAERAKKKKEEIQLKEYVALYGPEEGPKKLAEDKATLAAHERRKYSTSTPQYNGSDRVKLDIRS